MNSISDNLNRIRRQLPAGVELVAVSKFHPIACLQEAYAAGQRLFGESRVQELLTKQPLMPPDTCWHFIGHLQTNKVKQIVPFISLIESVDSLRLLQEIDRAASRIDRRVDVLLQIHIATEESKFGFSAEECELLLQSNVQLSFPHIRIRGLMGMATNCDDTARIRSEFETLATLFSTWRKAFFLNDSFFDTLSMGMSGDYPIAVAAGSTLVRIGSAIFGERTY